MVKKSHLFPNVHNIKPKDSLHELLFEGVTLLKLKLFQDNPRTCVLYEFGITNDRIFSLSDDPWTHMGFVPPPWSAIGKKSETSRFDEDRNRAAI